MIVNKENYKSELIPFPNIGELASCNGITFVKKTKKKCCKSYKKGKLCKRCPNHIA